MRRLFLVFSSVALVSVLSAVLWAGWFRSPGTPAAAPVAATLLGAYPLADAPAAPTTATIPEGLVALYVEFGSKGASRAKESTPWDGRLTVESGRLRDLRLWAPDPRNRVDGDRFNVTTRRKIPGNAAEGARGHEAMPLQDESLVIELLETGPGTTLSFETLQGDFKVPLADVGFGQRTLSMNGLVKVSRLAGSATILSAPTEDDYPAATVGPDGTLYVAYVAFTHGEGFRRRDDLPEPPKDYSDLAKPTGGDQVLLLTQKGDQFTGPVAVSPPGGDVFRPAVAVDSAGRVWIAWPAQHDGNWDLYARCLDGTTWSDTLRLTTDAGPDTFCVATTDSQGDVWIAWQAFRGGTSDILAVRQSGDEFGEPMVVADAEANLWTPAIAAGGDGRVAVVWDGYAKGNYDVSARIATRGRFGEEVPIAASLQAEMRPSASFDPQGRLWVAFEQSPERWGKDNGPMDRDAVGLYRSRTVAMRVLEGSRLLKPVDDPANAFKLSRGTGGGNLAVPRVAADDSGRIWLAVRASRLGGRVNVGTVWFEHATWYEGDRFRGEIVWPDSDGLLDNRPALVPASGGGILMVTSSDGRAATGRNVPSSMLKQLQRQGKPVSETPASKWPDPVNHELVMARFGPISTAPASPKLEPAAAPADGDAPSYAVAEAADVALARAARTQVAGKTLRLLRGEFHRHTEISWDGGGDGLLMDMWRYGIDATAMDWIGNGDHDNGRGREYGWWIVQKTTDMFMVPGAFTPMHSYERSCGYPDGHRNVVFPVRGIRTLPRLIGGKGQAMDALPADAERPNTPDTQMLFDYLRHFDGLCAGHTAGTNMGTDWRDNDPVVEPIVEIYQGCRQSYEMPGAPRAVTAENALGGYRPLGFISLALKKGYRLGFQSSSDHGSTHISYCSVWVEDPSRQGIFDAMQARHVYGATDNIIADVRSGEHFMGDEFTTKAKPSLDIRLTGTAPFAKVHVIKNGNYVYTTAPGRKAVELAWTDVDARAGETAYYYVRGEQEDNELVWVSPMWITYEP